MSSKASPFHLIRTKAPTSWLQYLLSFQSSENWYSLHEQLPDDTIWVHCVATMDGDDILFYVLQHIPQLCFLSTSVPSD